MTNARSTASDDSAPRQTQANATAAGADPARTGLAGSPTQVVRSFTPERSSESVPVEGTPSEQAAQLAALVGGLLA